MMDNRRKMMERALNPANEEEYCTSCWRLLGYPKSVDVDDPRRKGHYSEAGQTCEDCAAKVWPQR